MSGESDLLVLLASMEPVLDAEEHVFCTVSLKMRSTLQATPILEFREREGITAVIKKREAKELGLDFIYPCKLITLNIHSSLEAVGFLAAITRKLAAAGISVNAVSAYYHDHIFVPVEKADEAVKLLHELSAES